MRKLPSLRSMHYFEVVVRHGSFTEASRELCISQTAVSHQIKRLEEDLGTTVLARSTRHVEMTKSGEALYSAVTHALNVLTDTTQRIRASIDAEAGCLNLSVTPFFSGHWLVPRLPKFSRRFPKAQLNLHHSQQQPSRHALTASDPSQAFVMYGDGSWDGFEADYLFSADLIPMCSPTLLGGRTTLKGPDDILRFPLVHEFDYAWWERWFEHSGIRKPAVSFGPIVDDPNVLISAALNLQGIVLGPPLFYKDHIKAGLLVMPVGDEIRIPIDYYLIVPAQAPVAKEMRNLRGWMLKQAEVYHMEEPRSFPARRKLPSPRQRSRS